MADPVPSQSERQYERGMQEGLDLRDQLREQIADRDQDLKILSKEIDRLRQGLWDCAITAGMDHDGDMTPKHLASPDIVEVALREVREMRSDYEEALGGGRA